VHTSSTEATGASREGVVRWVLIIGLFLAIALLSIIWMTGALTQDEGDRHQNVSREIGAQEPVTDQGEPITPASSTASAASSSTATPAVAHPDAQSTPGDAPAGDPKPDAQ
jgi:hypothetical protein